MSNFVGQSGAANLAHRHRVFSDPANFNSYLGVAGEVAFLACDGLMIGALFNGVCPGGIMRWNMISGNVPIDEMPDIATLQAQLATLDERVTTLELGGGGGSGALPPDFRAAETVTTADISADFFDNPFLANRRFYFRGSTFPNYISEPTVNFEGGSRVYLIEHFPVGANGIPVNNHANPMSGGDIGAIALDQVQVLTEYGSASINKWVRVAKDLNSISTTMGASTWQEAFDQYASVDIGPITWAPWEEVVA